MSDVEFLVKLRDAATMIVDAANERLEKMAPPEAKHSKEDFDKLTYQTHEGSKGPYQQTTKEANKNSPVFQALQAILEKHNGFCHIGNYKYWFDRDDHNKIDRRQK